MCGPDRNCKLAVRLQTKFTPAKIRAGLLLRMFVW